MGLKAWIAKMKAESRYVKNYPDNVIFRRLLVYLNPYRRDVRLLITLLLITSISNMAYPIGMTLILQIIAPAEATSSLSLIIKNVLVIFGTNKMVQLSWVGITLITILFINFLAKRAYQYNINKLSHYVMNDLRFQLFSHMQKLSMKFYSDNPAGKLMSRITNDVGAVQALISTQIIQAIGDIFTVVTTVVLMFAMAWKLTFIILAFTPLFGLVFFFFGLKARYYWSKERKTIADITGILQEAISGSKTIKAFVTEDQNIETFNVANQANRDISLQAAKLNAFLQPITQVIVAIALGIIFYFGSKLIQSGDLDITLMLGYVILALQFINPFNNLGNLYNQAQSSLASGDRILLILDTKPDVVDEPNAALLPLIKGEIEYEHIAFRYVQDVPVLKDINLKTAPNQRVALVGFTGAGKSTFVSLLSRFYDPTEGRILIDGYDIKKVTMKSLRSQMGIVLQDTFLFSGTIMENIRYGKLGATDDEVIEAAKKVGAHPFIMNLPDEYKTDVRERGNLLSVGQRQLISFARALLANPPILILDEATSSVDPYTELKIQEALEVLLQGRNSFVIAHRLSTILNADMILVMENGQIIQRGDHEDLIKQGGLYKHLYEMQFKKPNEKESLDKSS